MKLPDADPTPADILSELSIKNIRFTPNVQYALILSGLAGIIPAGDIKLDEMGQLITVPSKFKDGYARTSCIQLNSESKAKFPSYFFTVANPRASLAFAKISLATTSSPLDLEQFTPDITWATIRTLNPKLYSTFGFVLRRDQSPITPRSSGKFYYCAK